MMFSIPPVEEPEKLGAVDKGPPLGPNWKTRLPKVAAWLAVCLISGAIGIGGLVYAKHIQDHEKRDWINLIAWIGLTLGPFAFYFTCSYFLLGRAGFLTSIIIHHKCPVCCQAVFPVGENEWGKCLHCGHFYQC